MTYKDEAADLLDKAVDVLLTTGWCKGELLNRKGEHCTMGALRRAYLQPGKSIYATQPFLSSGTDSFRVAVYALESQIKGPLIGEWNDEPQRTLDEVIEALRQASKDLRNEATVA